MNQIQSEKNSDTLYRKIYRCRCCNSKHLLTVIDLDGQPNANSLLSKQDEKSVIIPLVMGFCERCKTLQQLYSVSKSFLFKDYIYFSSTSALFQKHFTDLALSVVADFKPAFVVDIGSNDGIFIKNFKDSDIKAVGIEPAENVAKVANEAGLTTEVGWIEDQEFVRKFIEKYGKADIVVACNVFAHVNNIRGFLSNVKKMLNNDGVFIIEVAHLLKFVENKYFDTIYHEHFFIHSVLSLSNLFHYSGMKIVKAEEIETHGGSIRLYVQKKKQKHIADESVRNIISKEFKAGLNYASTYIALKDRIDEQMRMFKAEILKLNQEKKRIAGFGAPAKANTLINYLKLTLDDVICIADDAPAKQNKFMPVSKIAIVSQETLLNKIKPDYIIIFAWNFKDSIIKKLKEAGYTGKFIVPFSEPFIYE